MRALMTLLGLALTVSLAAQDKPLSQADLAKKPPYERMLKGDDAKKAADLMKRLTEAEATNDFASAIKSAEELLALRTRIQGADHYETINEQVEIARLQKLSEQSDSKRSNYRAALRAAIEAKSLVIEGRYTQAYPTFKQYLDQCREIFQEDHPRTAQAYNNLAYIQSRQGKIIDALQLYHKALVIYRKVLGEDHPDTALSYNNIATSLQSQKNAADGQPYYEKALVIYRIVFGEEDPQTLLVVNNLATNLQSQGKLAEAQVLFENTLSTRKRVLGAGHPDLAVSYSNLAINLNSQGKAVEAQVLLEQSLAILLKVYGEEHPDTATVYMNLAISQDDQGKTAEAQPFLEKALTIRKKFFGEKHLETATAYNNLAMNLRDQGKEVEAQSLFKKALEIQLSLVGEDHPETAILYMNLAVGLTRQGNAEEAQPNYERALATFRKVFGEDHPDSARCYSNLALNLEKLGKLTDAQFLHQRSLAIRLKVFGEHHPETALGYNNLGGNLDDQGKVTEAQALLQKALDINRVVLGEAHPESLTSYNNVSLNLFEQGKVAEAEMFLRQAIFSAEASRLTRAKGIERAIGSEFNPRLLLAAIEQVKSPLEAWSQFEMTLARGLLDQQVSSPLTTADRVEQSRLQGRVTDLQSQILVLVSKPKRTDGETARLDGLIRDRQEVGQKLAKLAVAESERAVANREQIQAALPAEAALLLWVDVTATGGVEEHWGCVVRREGEPFWVRLPSTGEQGKWTKDDSELPAKVRVGLAAGVPPSNLSDLIEQLRKQRIEPLLDDLKKNGITQLYVVGVNEMAGIPVEVIAPEFAISYVPSGTFLARMPKKPKFENTLLAVGDPIYEVKKAKQVELTALPTHGLLVQGLAPGGAAEKLGLQPGDVLLNYGDTKIEKLDQLRPAIQQVAKSGDKTVAVTVWRIVEDNQAVEKTLQFPVGPLGVILAQEPAPVAIADRRKTEALFAKLNRGDEWTDLPGTRFEVSQIAKLFPSARVLLDGSASERSVDALRQADELKRFRYLHFATHGKGNNITAFESKLILSQDQPKGEIKAGEPYFNNEISAREVLDFWKLNADLVTLSACQTGLGKSGSGDGLLGFAQAFLLSGARSVCLSLWEVDDTATALLMQRFYQNLLGQRSGLTAPMSKQLALKEAKEWLRDLTNAQATELTASLMNGVSRGTRGEIKIKNRIKADAPPESKPYANPHYWSAFILIGDPE